MMPILMAEYALIKSRPAKITDITGTSSAHYMWSDWLTFLFPWR